MIATPPDHSPLPVRRLPSAGVGPRRRTGSPLSSLVVALARPRCSLRSRSRFARLASYISTSPRRLGDLPAAVIAVAGTSFVSPPAIAAIGGCA